MLCVVVHRVVVVVGNDVCEVVVVWGVSVAVVVNAVCIVVVV